MGAMSAAAAAAARAGEPTVMPVADWPAAVPAFLTGVACRAEICAAAAAFLTGVPCLAVCAAALVVGAVLGLPRAGCVGASAARVGVPGALGCLLGVAADLWAAAPLA